jgi:hypothetical protein
MLYQFTDFITSSPVNTFQMYIKRSGAIFSSKKGFNLRHAADVGATFLDVLSCAAALVGRAIRISRQSYKMGNYGTIYTNLVEPVMLSYNVNEIVNNGTTTYAPEYVLGIDSTNAITRKISDTPNYIRGVVYGSEGFVNYGLTESIRDEDTPKNYKIMDIGNNILLPYEHEIERGYTWKAYEGAVRYSIDYDTTHIAFWGSGTKNTALKLHDCEITWYGNPAIEAGDTILYAADWSVGSDTPIVVMENVYRPHRISTLKSFGSVNDPKYSVNSGYYYGGSSMMQSKDYEEALSNDSGWIDLSVSGTGFSAPTSGSKKPRYRKIDNRVYLQGQIMVDMTAKSGSISYTDVFAALPSECQPSQFFYILVPAQGARYSAMLADAAGNLSFAYFKDSTGANVTSGEYWIQIDCSYLTD